MHLVMLLFFFPVAKRYEKEYGLMRLSMGEALRKIIATQPKTNLVAQILEYLKAGREVPDELATQALEVIILDIQSQTRG